MDGWINGQMDGWIDKTYDVYRYMNSWTRLKKK